MSDAENLQTGGPEKSGQETSVVNPNGSFVDNWYEKYDEADHPTLKRYKTFDNFVTSHMSQRRMINKDPDRLVEIPNETTSDEDREAFHRARGVPDKVEDYKYEKGKDLSDNIDIDDEKIAAFSQIAKNHNLTQEQFLGVANDYLALIDKDITAFDLVQEEKRQKDFELAEAALKKDFGKSYEERVARANLLLRKYKGNEMVAELGLENNPAMTRFLDAIAEDMSEDRIKGLAPSSTPTSSDVDDKIAELKAHDAFMDRKHPQHKQVVDQLTELYKKRKPA